MSEWETTVSAVEAKARWTAAKKWLLVWASAGYTARCENGKLFLSAAWKEKFPDGPLIVEMLRSEICSLLAEGNAAVLKDPRLQVAYPDYLASRILVEENRLKHAERCVRKSKEELDGLRKDQQEAAKFERPA